MRCSAQVSPRAPERENRVHRARCGGITVNDSLGDSADCDIGTWRCCAHSQCDGAFTSAADCCCGTNTRRISGELSCSGASLPAVEPSTTNQRASSASLSYAHVGGGTRPSSSVSQSSSLPAAVADVSAPSGGSDVRRREMVDTLRARGVHLYVADLESKTSSQLADLVAKTASHD